MSWAVSQFFPPFIRTELKDIYVYFFGLGLSLPFFVCKNSVDVVFLILNENSNGFYLSSKYIISEDLFESLSPEEKKLWHSHVHEVKSGELIAPGVPDIAEKEVMKDIIQTYGKTFHSE